MSGKAVSVTEINTDEISTEYNTYDSDGKLQESENSDGEEATQRTVPCVLLSPVFFYEEPLNESVIEAAALAISSADMLIIGGTSLAVYPAANFIRYFKGESIVLINRDETQYDGMATLVFGESIGEVLESVMLSPEF